MKNTGLRNRFSSAVRHVWLYWYSCMVCGRNQQDALHHIISPSLHVYVDGEHNESVFNSSPIHNQICHVGNEAWLGANVSVLLNKTQNALMEMGYEPNELDNEFLATYASLYA